MLPLLYDDGYNCHTMVLSINVLIPFVLNGDEHKVQL